MWAVLQHGNIVSLYTKEADAKEFFELLDKTSTPSKIMAATFPRYRATLEVKEIFEDCYLGKLRKGYKLFSVALDKDGTLVSADEVPLSTPSIYGYKRVLITYQHNKVDGKSVKTKKLIYRNLCANVEEAVELAQKERIKRLLDDIWDDKVNHEKGFI